MKDFFYPESVAVVGVSASPTNLARAIVYHLIEFHYTGRILPLTHPPASPEGEADGGQAQTSADRFFWTQIACGDTRIATDITHN